MTIDLTAEELSIIQDWYNAAAGESASGASVYPPLEYRTEDSKSRYKQDVENAKRVRALISRLGFELHCMDGESLD